MKVLRILPVASAVALALGGGTASALDRTATLNAIAAGNSLVVAGASAQRDGFLQLMNTDVCAAGTLHVFRANPTANQDFRAYSCHSVSNTGAGSIGAALGVGANLDVVVFYRAEGGSAWGPYSIAQRNVQAGFVGIKSLSIDNCPVAFANANFTLGGVVVALPTFECPLGANNYRLATDTLTSGTGLVDRQTQLGTADTEPKLFQGTNNPATVSTKFTNSPAIVSNLASLPFTTAFGQVFNLFVNNSAASANASDEVTGLSSAEATGILTGTIFDWCTIRPTIADCGGGGSHPITVIRREPGSGTQVAAGVQFARAGCGDAWTFVVDSDAPGAGDTDGVIEIGASALLETTVGATLDSIGINIYKNPAPTGTKALSLDGVAPSNTNLSYTYAYEATYSKAGTAVLPAGGVPNALADGLISLSKAASRIPVNPAVFAIPSATNPPGGTGALGQPIAAATRGGASCRPFQPRD